MKFNLTRKFSLMCSLLLLFSLINAKYLCQIVQTFFNVVLHSMSLCHTDLKPENMLFVDSSCDVFRNEDVVSLNFHFCEKSLELIELSSINKVSLV